MKIVCSNCGQRVALDGSVAGQTVACPACGAANSFPDSPPDSLAPESEREMWQQKRRRFTAMIAVAILLLLGLLTWLLIHPSGNRSAARQMKNVIFGSRVTEAVEEATQSSDGHGQGASGQSGEQASGEAGERGDGQSGSARGGAANRNGRQDDQPEGDVNPQLPNQTGSGLDAPPERSIGWLDRFFGTQERNGPIQSGEGGIGTDRRASGNTNATIAHPTNEPIATEITQTAPSPELPLNPDTPPPARETNRAAVGNATLNDNLEQLLRQHRAGSGDIRISLMWNNRNDIDLHVVDPTGEEISYNNRQAQSGGLLDIDMNAGFPLRAPAVENVFWPVQAAPIGAYRIYVNHYSIHDRVNDTDFTVRVLVRGRTTDFQGRIRWREPKRLVHKFTLGAGN